MLGLKSGYHGWSEERTNAERFVRKIKEASREAERRGIPLPPSSSDTARRCLARLQATAVLNRLAPQTDDADPVRARDTYDAVTGYELIMTKAAVGKGGMEAANWATVAGARLLLCQAVGIWLTAEAVSEVDAILGLPSLDASLGLPFVRAPIHEAASSPT
jgi:hypothetical protein